MNSLKERFDHLDAMIEKNLIIRKQWTSHGQERACLLAAISPEAGEQQSAASCPAAVLPAWFAERTPAMDDNGTVEAWPAFIKRYAVVVRRAAETLDAEGWRRAEHRVKDLGVEEAMKHTSDAEVLAVCTTVRSLHNRSINGEVVSADEWSAAESAAWSAARSAAWSAAWSAESAAWSAAESAAWDRMNDAILDALEIEVSRMGGHK